MQQLREVKQGWLAQLFILGNFQLYLSNFYLLGRNLEWKLFDD